MNRTREFLNQFNNSRDAFFQSHRKSRTYQPRKHKITRDEKGDAIILIPGEYVNYYDKNRQFIHDPAKRGKAFYYTSMAHTLSIEDTEGGKSFKRFPTLYCSQGMNFDNPKPCALCYAKDLGKKTVGESHLRYAVNIFHLDRYIRTAVYDKEGKKVENRDGGLMYRWVQLRSMEEAKRDSAVEFAEAEWGEEGTKYGHHKFLDLGTGQMGQLAEIVKGVSKSCGNCGGVLVEDYLHCPNCGDVLAESSRYTVEELLDLGQRPYTCKKCGGKGFPEMGYRCAGNEDEGKDGCGEALSMDPFECVIRLRLSGEKQKTKIDKVRHSHIDRFRLPASLQGVTLRDLIKDIKPMNFDEMLAPLTLGQQVRAAKLENDREIAKYLSKNLGGAAGDDEEPKTEEYDDHLS